MFESKINRGKANGYAPLDGDGKVPLSKLPPIQSTIDTGSLVTINQTGSFATTSSLQTLIDGTGSFTTTSSLQTLIDGTGSLATTGSNLFYGNQSISGSVNISSSLVVSSTVVNNGSIGALNSDLIIDGGDIIVSGSQYMSGSLYFGISNTLIKESNQNLKIEVGGIPNNIGSITSNSGGWDVNQGTNLSATGGSGNGLIVDIVGNESGYITSITINTPGSGYSDDDSITVTNGGSYVTFNISVAAWVFDTNNSLTTTGDIIVSGSLILSSSSIPSAPTGSAGDTIGTLVFDENFMYYCTKPYIASTTASGTAFTVTASGATHIYDLGVNTWNSYHTVGSDPYLSTGPSEEGGGTNAPIYGWYFVDDSGTIRQILNTPVWFSGGEPTPYPNGNGWMCVVDSNDWVYSDSNPTLTFHESLPTVNFDGQVIPATPGSGEIWTKTKLERTPNYAPFGSGSYDGTNTITQLDINKSLHLINITDKSEDSHFYLPNGYDGQVVRFALKGNGYSSNSVYVWMDNLRQYDGQLQSNANWSPFYDNNGMGYDNPRSLATAVFIDGAWNIDSDWFNMY